MLGRWGLVAMLMGTGLAQGGAACKRVLVPGEVKYGEGFERAFGNGLKVYLQPIRAGWILRVLPGSGGRVAHDYAELATPPYNSVNPLSISTDFSFRAQDAVGWNPRAFRFVSDRVAFDRLSAAYARLMAGGTTPPAAAQVEVARLAAKGEEGRFRILDARLIPGTADQWVQAGAVASHFTTTAHTLEQPVDEKGSALGRLVWLRFVVELDVPESFVPAAGLKVQRCGMR